MDYDFGGYATKCGLVCTDGRVILPNAFKHNDGARVPIVWQHDYSSPENILGYGVLENRNDGVYIYGSFNDSPKAKLAKHSIEHGDITSMSIKAIDVRQNGNDVVRGNIKEVSLVVGGANPGAKIDTIMTHDDSGECEVIITSGDDGLEIFEHDFDNSIYDDPEDLDDEIEDEEDDNDETSKKEPEDDESEDEESEEEPDDSEVEHADEQKTVKDILNSFTDEENNLMYFIIGKIMEDYDIDIEQSNENQNGNTSTNVDSNNKTVEDILNGMSKEKQDVMYYVIGEVISDAGVDIENIEKEVEHSMKKRIFEDKNGEIIHDNENGSVLSGNDFVLTHDDEKAIIALAKKERTTSFKETAKAYLQEKYGLDDKSFEHGVFSEGDLQYLHPDYKLIKEGEPDTYTYSQAWVEGIFNKVGKSPKSRLRVRVIDAKTKMLKAKGYIKGKAKTNIGNVKLINRTVDPQTVYVKDELHRDDVNDITDFDIAVYENKILQMMLKQELALDFLVGDGREEGDPDKVYEEHIKPIWTDNEMFTIHKDIDLEAMKTKLQGTDTEKYFGEEFILIEAFIEALRTARIDYNGSGDLDVFCTPTIVNKMLLARDRNGRRIYNTLDELKSALNVRNIYEVELLDGLVRTDSSSVKHKLHAIFVNFADYETGANKGGQITSFDDFDIDFNQLQFLKETRLSGMLTRIKSAIVIEEKQG